MLASAPMTTVTLILPTLDEASTLERHLPSAAAQADEVVVSDGGSGDATVEVARRLGAKVVAGPPGRGGQLNRGAAAARGDILLFLHADTHLPPGSVDRVRRAVAAGAVGGGFHARFDDPGFWMGLGSRLVHLRTRLTRVPLGDQAHFCTKTAFDALGGYRDWPILEDLDFARRLKSHGKTAILAPPVVTAARRYLTQGIARTIVLNWLIWLLFFTGISPRRLARLYRKIR